MEKEKLSRIHPENGGRHTWNRFPNLHLAPIVQTIVAGIVERESPWCLNSRLPALTLQIRRKPRGKNISHGLAQNLSRYRAAELLGSGIQIQQPAFPIQSRTSVHSAVKQSSGIKAWLTNHATHPLNQNFD